MEPDRRRPRVETATALAGLDSTLVSEQDILYGMVLDRLGDTRDAVSPG